LRALIYELIATDAASLTETHNDLICAEPPDVLWNRHRDAYRRIFRLSGLCGQRRAWPAMPCPAWKQCHLACFGWAF